MKIDWMSWIGNSSWPSSKFKFKFNSNGNSVHMSNLTGVSVYLAQFHLKSVFYGSDAEDWNSDFCLYEFALAFASFFFSDLIWQCLGGIQQLRGPILTQFWPPPPSSGQEWTFYNPPCPLGQKGQKAPASPL